MKKYELTKESMMIQGRELFRIKALVSFGNVKEGEMGGYIEKEDNLSQNGNSWVSGYAKVYGNATVEEYAVVCGKAIVKENAAVGGNALIDGDAIVRENAIVDGNAWVIGNAEVRGHAAVGGYAIVGGHAVVEEYAVVDGNARVRETAVVRGKATVSGTAVVGRDADYAVIKGLGSVYRDTTFYRIEDDGIGVTCGCFSGSIQEFRQKVLETHGNSRFAKEYLIAADLMELHFENDIKTIP